MESAFKVYGNARGKMSGISHISIAEGQSPVCKTCKVNNICYAKRIYTHVKNAYTRNGEALTSKVFDYPDLPVVNTIICRFNAFGELFTGKKGITQLTNYINTAKKNPLTTFVLWSRNYNLVESYFKTNEKPANMRLIRSTSEVDRPVSTIPQVWDGVFNVVSKEYVEKNGVEINCGMIDTNGDKIGCLACPTGCYTRGNKVIVFEVQK